MNTLTCGDRFSMLTFISNTDKRTNDGHLMGTFRCDCGTVADFSVSRVKNGYTKSCGCLIYDGSKNRTHGMRYSPEYRHWCSVKNRCRNTNSKDYIKYSQFEHDDIVDSFESFFAELGPRPSPNHSVDRIDNRDGYRRGNVRWATRREQARNTKTSYWIYIRGVKYDGLREAAEALGVKIQTIHKWCHGYVDHKSKNRVGGKEWAIAVLKYQSTQ